MKPAPLLLGTNMAIVLVPSNALNVPSVAGHFKPSDLNLESMLIFAAVMGLGGSVLSLAPSGKRLPKDEPWTA